MTERFCKDCKHGKGELQSMACDSPNNVIEVVDTAKYLVTGEPQPVIRAIRGASCTALRVQRTPEIDATCCGPDGKWFEPKE